MPLNRTSKPYTVHEGWQLATSSSQRNALHDACAVGRLDMAMMLLEDAPGALHKCDKQAAVRELYK